MKGYRTIPLLVAAAVLLGTAPLLEAKTIKVGGESGSETIDDALVLAEAGDTVFVAEGVYSVPEGIAIETKGLVLKGAGADRTILDGEGGAYAVVKVQAKGVVVTGFTLANGSSHGVYVSEKNWANVHHNVITGNADRGILLGMGEPYAVIDHNSLVDNEVSAVYSYRDEPNTKITNNVMSGNGRAIVVDEDENGMTVKYNCFWGQSNDSLWAAKHKTNLCKDPMFVDADEDFHLAEGSPCLGKGENGSNIGALGEGTNPPRPEAPEPVGFEEYRVVVFTLDEALGEDVLAMLSDAGFTNEDNYVNDESDDEPMIQYGSATKAALQEIQDLLDGFYDEGLEESQDFGEDDNDIFIYLP